MAIPSLSLSSLFTHENLLTFETLKIEFQSLPKTAVDLCYFCIHKPASLKISKVQLCMRYLMTSSETPSHFYNIVSMVYYLFWLLRMTATLFCLQSSFQQQDLDMRLWSDMGTIPSKDEDMSHHVDTAKNSFLTKHKILFNRQSGLTKQTANIEIVFYHW